MPSDHFPPPPGSLPQLAGSSPEPAGPSYRVPPSAQPRAGLDHGTKRLVMVACGLGAALAAVVGGWAMMGGGDRPVPVFEADGRPLRVKPENPGGMQVAGLDEVDGKAAGMAPQPEVPSPQALRAQLPSTRPAAPSDPAPSPSAIPRTGWTPSTAKAVAPPEGGVQGEADRAVPPTAPAQTQTAAPPPTPPRAAAAGGSAAPAPAAASVAPAAPAPVSAAPVSAALVQLAAVGSERAAQAEWQRLAKRMPDLLGGRKPTVQRVDRDGRTIWRVRTGGFTDLADAASFCARVRAKGASCSIASF